MATEEGTTGLITAATPSRKASAVMELPKESFLSLLKKAGKTTVGEGAKGTEAQPAKLLEEEEEVEEERG